jgi:phage terminase large subunit-like protein
MKSNPTLGTIKKWDYMEEQVALAKDSKADRIFVLSKDFNLKQNAAVAWLNIEDYDYNTAFDPEDFRGSFALGAVDLAETTDLVSAKAIVMRKDDQRKYVISHYFLPENKLIEADDKSAGAKYKEWIEAGYMTATEGADVDLAQVADWFYRLYTELGIRVWKVGYDQRFSKDWIKRMEYYGWMRSGGDESDLVMINQNAQTLTNAIKLTESDLKHRLVMYNDNPVDKWCFGNAGIKVDGNGCLIVKMETRKRIDGAVCLAIAYEMYRRYRTEYRALTEEQGQ